MKKPRLDNLAFQEALKRGAEKAYILRQYTGGHTMKMTFEIEFNDIKDVQPGKAVTFCYVLVGKDLTLETAWYDSEDNGFWNSTQEDAWGVGDVRYWALKKNVKKSKVD
jgi:hypothetical protein